MADIVIVVGTKRGKEDVSILDLKQMCGRAGRKHGGETALAQIIVEEDKIVEVKDGLENGQNMNVLSSFDRLEGLLFHIMPEIVSGMIYNLESAEKWFQRSLAALQGRKVNFRKVFEKMESMGAIRRLPGDIVMATKTGIIASDLYFHPEDVQSWKDNFTKLFELGLENDNAAIAWALGTRYQGKSQGDFGEHRYLMSEYKSSLPMGLDAEPGTIIQTTLWWCLMGGPPAGKMRNQMLELREDMGRIKRALVRLDKEYTGWNRESFFNDLDLMVHKGISVSLLDLCKLPGITKGKAEYLYNMGARDADGIADIFENIEDDIEESFVLNLKGIIDGLSRKSC
jgi:hypothetical protein